MRQGPEYSMNIIGSLDHPDALYIPYELHEYFEGCWSAKWIDNKDGTFTVIPHHQQNI